MPQKQWRIDGNFVATPEEFLLQGNPTKQTTHCALVHFYGENDPVLLVRMITMLQSSIGKLFELNVQPFSILADFCPVNVQTFLV